MTRSHQRPHPQERARPRHLRQKRGRKCLQHQLPLDTEGSDDVMPSVAVPSGEGTTTSYQTEEVKGEERLVLASMSSHIEGHDNLMVDQRPRPPEEGQPRAEDMGKEGTGRGREERGKRRRCREMLRIVLCILHGDLL